MNKLLLNMLLSFFLWMPSNLAAENVSEKEVLKSIRTGHTATLQQFIDQGAEIDAQYDNNKYTLLNYSIREANLPAVKLLIEHGANPNLPSKEKTPLTHSILKNDLMILHYLINHGAALDLGEKKGNTPLIIAAKYGRMECVKMLVERGADVLKVNDNGVSALDAANQANYVEVATYLVRIIEMRNYYKGLPAYTDGPHMDWMNDTLLRMFYMIYDTSTHTPYKKEKFVTVSADTASLKGFASDSLDYTICRESSTSPSVYEDVDKVLAIGDIHGHFYALIKYLQINEVIDENLNWTWGTGHIVFLGDVFDRGNEVTESLWFIYQLGLKASKQGGRVHMLLGNHEVMVMLNDTRYLNRKYEMFSNYFTRDYADFFNMNSVLGSWLRTRNTIIKINDCIFSHAGISPVVAQRKISIEKMNSLLRDFLAVEPTAPMKNARLTSMILNSDGPLWYRGYILDGIDGNKAITENQVNNILKQYKASKLIIAHTEVKKMSSLFDGKVIAIDVPIRTEEAVPEALLIKNGKFYRLTSDGRMIGCLFENL